MSRESAVWSRSAVKWRRPEPPDARAASTAPLVVVRPAVEVVGLHVTRRRRPILRGLSFAVPAGAVTGVLGPVGAGKTTLLRCLVGAQRITDGSALVLGLPAGSRGLRGRVG